VADGGDWRSVIDGVRPFTQRLWQTLPPASRPRFLRHARAWWNVHRHRMAPEIEMRLAGLIAQGAHEADDSRWLEACRREEAVRKLLSRSQGKRLKMADVRGVALELAVSQATLIDSLWPTPNALHVTPSISKGATALVPLHLRLALLAGLSIAAGDPAGTLRALRPKCRPLYLNRFDELAVAALGDLSI
jgi:hypothetical protein